MFLSIEKNGKWSFRKRNNFRDNSPIFGVNIMNESSNPNKTSTYFLFKSYESLFLNTPAKTIIEIKSTFNEYDIGKTYCSDHEFLI